MKLPFYFYKIVDKTKFLLYNITIKENMKRGKQQ